VNAKQGAFPTPPRCRQSAAISWFSSLGTTKWILVIRLTATLPDAASPPLPLPAQSRAGRDKHTEHLVESLQQCHDEHERSVLRDELVATNMAVAQSIASRYRGRGIPLEDLEQVAYLALTKAAHRFDPEAGHAFLSFCVPTIRGEVRRYFRDQGWMVRPPRRVQELQQRVLRTQPELAGALGHPPSAQELADHLDETMEDVLEALDGQGCFTPVSLDRPTGGEDGEGAALGELLGEEDGAQEGAEARVVLGPAVRQLSDRDKRILRLRFFEGLTQREIADDIGVTQMQVSRLLSRIFRDIREELGAFDKQLAVGA
jgi:RNA polymerase sigma-B factor